MNSLPQTSIYENQINIALEDILSEIQSSPIYDATRYCVFNGGKRLRPLLVYLTGETLGLSLAQLNPIACAIELIHCYSLVHDDLPAMDNADLRRGQLTCHKAYNEATAILVGDTLLTLAFELLAKTNYLSGNKKAELIQHLAKYSGGNGMIKGQVLDLNSTNQVLSENTLKELCLYKTGYLLIACVHLPAIAKKISQDTKQNLLYFAECVGLGYQIHDDLLDIESDTTTLGKQTGIDKKNHKNTFPTILGIQEAKKTLSLLQEKAIHHLSLLPFNTAALQQFTNQIFERKK